MTESISVTPPALSNGSKIAVIAPSDRLECGDEKYIGSARLVIGGDEVLGAEFKDMELELAEICKGDLKGKGIQSSIETRKEEIHEAFSDPEIVAIICTTGGSNANELLPYLDYDLIKGNPKIFCGLSDITMLHSAFFQKAGLRTFYGPTLLPFFNKPEFVFTRKSFIQAVRSCEPIGGLPRTFNSRWEWLVPGRAKGIILGGCLHNLVQLQGTEYAPSYERAILLIENHENLDGNERGPERVKRGPRADIANLMNAGVFGKIAGLVIGKPRADNDWVRKSFYECVLGFCKMTKSKFPVLANVDVGHAGETLTIPLGAQCVLDSSKNLWEIVDAGVVEPTQ